MVETQLRGAKKQKKKKNGKGTSNSEELEGSWTRWTAFISCHEWVAVQLQFCLEMYETPDLFTTVRAALIMKNKEKGIDFNKFRPITYLL